MRFDRKLKDMTKVKKAMAQALKITREMTKIGVKKLERMNIDTRLETRSLESGGRGTSSPWWGPRGLQSWPGRCL